VVVRHPGDGSLQGDECADRGGGARFEREQTTAEGLDDDGAGHLDRLVRAESGRGLTAGVTRSQLGPVIPAFLAILPAALGVGSGTLLLVLVVPRITLANINKT
jgi:hypothetical protein